MSNRYPKFITYKIELMISISHLSVVSVSNGTTFYQDAYQGWNQGIILDCSFPDPLHLLH